MFEIGRPSMQGAPPADFHPDENLLAAFVEGALAGRLRIRVLSHLCACPACRKVIAISGPEIISATTPAVAVRWAWPRWPTLSWAAAATAMLVVAVWIGWMERNITLPPVTVPVRTAAASSGPASQLPPRSRVPVGKPLAVIAARGKRVYEKPTGNMINTGLETGGSPELVSPPPAAGMAVQSWSAPMWQEQLLPSAAAGSESGKPGHTRWMVTPSGVLYQSFDNGTRWQSVAVREDVGLRSVSAAGDEIWVGGNAGALFYSSDAGRHWTQVIPSCNGLNLVDDIERVEFTDANHGAITTASGKTWVTEDRGQTWTIE